MYKIAHNALNDISLEIEINEIKQKLINLYGFNDEFELYNNIKDFLLIPNELENHCLMFNYTKEEYIKILVIIFPEIFNYKFIAYIKGRL